VLPHVGVEVVTGSPAAIRALATDPRVAGVAPDDRVQLTGHDYKNRGDTQSAFAWQGLGDKVGKGTAGAGVTVAVLDTGVSDTPALNRASARLVDGVDVSRLASGGEARTSGTFTDAYGHGTFMANLIAGGPVDQVASKRTLGVAPGARVVVVKVSDDRGLTSLSQVLAGMDWVAAQAPKIQVVNIALSHDRPGSAYGADPLTAAVEHLTQGGLIVVAASGNTRGEVGDPGLAPQALTVGAADLTNGDTGDDRRKNDSESDTRNARVADFSGSANVAGVRKPDLVASGVGLLSVLPRGSVISRQHPDALQDNGLYRGSGTSESTAVTSGAVAVLLSNHPEARLVDVKPALRVAADDIEGGRAGGQGLLDLSSALKGLRKYTKSGGNDASGESALDTAVWNANCWQRCSWEGWLARAWAANSWAADGTWAANSWSSATWGTESWSANSWAANSWAANSWAANSWAANSWAANSWAANSWAANSWAANSWAASSWADQSWGDDR
jgi:serine protease AprX